MALSRYWFVWGVVLFGFVFSALAAEAPIELGHRRELFVDRMVIDSINILELRLHHPRPNGAVYRFDRPWEGRYCGYATILRDGGAMRLYYRGLPESGADGSQAETTCVAFSQDGIEWTRPSLGLHEINGSRENNVILSGSAPYSHNFAPFIDERPGVKPEERYKAIAGVHRTGLHGFVSADGLRWKMVDERPSITEGAFDSQNVAFWSEAEGRYVCYFRTWTQGEFKGFRAISRCTSDDFIHWTAPAEMTYGEPLQEHLYTNQTSPYFRAPQLYLSLAARFMPGRRVLSQEQFARMGGEAAYSGDCSDVVLMSSRGGDQYDRIFRESFIRPGDDPANWSSRTNYAARGIVPTGGDEISVYVQRHYGQPTHYLERLTLRVDGFASLHAGFDRGEMTTRPLKFDGKELVLNYSTSAAGSVWIEIQDLEGNPIEGFTMGDFDELAGDQIERTVSWGGSDLGQLAGRPVRLRFILKDADVYSFMFR
ncbi:MAG: hypothetical protein GC154_06950 [bacterium]|nr:hypothetical protein [bacterium]